VELLTEQTVKSELTANVWKIEVSIGDRVEEDDTLLILESMKMEIPVTAPRAGTVTAVAVQEGDVVTEGQLLFTIGH
jgi:acetyl-CoA carboxylase biotin carboxyl carrier protein